MSYDSLTIPDAVAILRSVPAEVTVACDAVDAASRRIRPDPDTWSIVEYACHIRDVYAAYTIRLHRTRTEDRPLLEPMLNDLRARRFGYNTLDLTAVLAELAANVGGFVHEIGRMPDNGWDRVAGRLPGEDRTARWLVRQATHEGVHHCRDIVEVARLLHTRRA